MVRWMQYVYAVYQEKSFSKAAARLYISQPSLSNAIKKAEKEIGFSIFDRSTVPIQLTELGQEYIRSIEIIMDAQKGLQNYVNDINELNAGNFTIGGTSLFASYIIPQFLFQFMEKYPKVHINLVEGARSELIEKLNVGEIDLLIDNMYFSNKMFESKHIYDEHLLLTVPKRFEVNLGLEKYAMTADDVRDGKHIGPKIKPVELNTFKDVPFIMQKVGNDSRIRAEYFCKEADFNPKIRLEPDGQITTYNATCTGLGASFTGDILVKHVPANNNILYYKLASKEATRMVRIYHKRNRYLPKAAKEFFKMVSE